MSKWGWGEKLALAGVIIAIITIAANGVVTPEVRCWFKLKSDVCSSEPVIKDNATSSPTPNSSPSSATPPPVEVSSTPTQEPLAEKSPPNSPPPIPSQEPPNISLTPAVGASNCNSYNIGGLKNTCSFNNRVTSQKQENVYFFTLDRPSDISIFLDNVTSSVEIRLYVDTNGNGIIDSGESLSSDTAYSSRAGVIKQTLGADNYIVVVKFISGNSAYNLQIVNNTNEAVNVGSLKGTINFTGHINRNIREKYYRFSLSNPSDVRLSLDNVTNSLGIRLYVDTNGNGVIDSGESVDSRTAYSSSAGVIRGRLGADNYFVIIAGSEGNTNYRLTMFAP